MAYDFDSLNKLLRDSEIREMLKRVIDDYNDLERKHLTVKSIIQNAARNIESFN